MAKEISLTKGMVALVDNEDYPYLAKLNWFAQSNGLQWYARRNSQYINKKRHIVHMHRVIMEAPPWMLVDHLDGNGLNNTRENLRLCTHQGNSRNGRKRNINTSGYKGVSWHKVTQKWMARIGVDGRSIHLGLHDTATEAALAYDVAALKYHGEFACVNFGSQSREDAIAGMRLDDSYSGIG